MFTSILTAIIENETEQRVLHPKVARIAPGERTWFTYLFAGIPIGLLAGSISGVLSTLILHNDIAGKDPVATTPYPMYEISDMALIFYSLSPLYAALITGIFSFTLIALLPRKTKKSTVPVHNWKRRLGKFISLYIFILYLFLFTGEFPPYPW